jgi:hypothetical protein
MHFMLSISFLFVGEHNANPTVRLDLVLVGTVFVGVETRVFCVPLYNICLDPNGFNSYLN